MAIVMTTQSSASATTPAAAAVLDFNCIYTHDIMRKRQKRWQDGFLRFHTFNKRVMVYDVPRNFIGDTHLKGDQDLSEGDELSLDRGVMVEVGEQCGRSEQDIRPLFEKATPKKDYAGATTAMQASGTIRRAQQQSPLQARTPQMLFQQTQHPSTPLGLIRPKSLNAVLGPRTGLTGRARLPEKSPYQQRHVDLLAENDEIERPAKRQRRAIPEDETRPAADKLAGAGTARTTDRGSTTLTNTTNRSSMAQDPVHRVSEIVGNAKDAIPGYQQSLSRNRSPPDRHNHNDMEAPRDLPGQKEAPELRKKTIKLSTSNNKRPKLLCGEIKRKPSAPPIKDYRKATASPKHAYRHRQGGILGHEDIEDDAGPSTPPFQPATEVVQHPEINISSDPDIPLSTNFTVMDFPVSQDSISQPPQPPPPPLPRRLSSDTDSTTAALARLDAELLPKPSRAQQIDKPPAKPHSIAQTALSKPAPLSKVNINTTAISKPGNTPKHPPSKADAAPLQAPPEPGPPPLEQPTQAKPREASYPNQPRSTRASPLRKSFSDPAPAKFTNAGPATAQPSLQRSATATSIPKPAVVEETAPHAKSHEADTGPWSRCAFDLFGFVVAAGDRHNREKVDKAKRECVAIGGSERAMFIGFED